MLRAEATSMAESRAKTCVRFAHVICVISSGLSQGSLLYCFHFLNINCMSSYADKAADYIFPFVI